MAAKPSVRQHPALSLFRDNSLFANVAPTLLDALIAQVEPRSCGAEEVIFQEGDAADGMYLIGSGTVRIAKIARAGKYETLVYLEQGDFFGEMALYDPAPRSTQAVASEGSVLGFISADGLRAMFDIAQHEITRNLIVTSVRRLRRADAYWVDQLLRHERLSLVGNVVSELMHDVRNPLSTILGAAELMEESRNDPQIVRKSADIVRRSVHNLTLMAQEVLDFSRGKTQVALRVVAVDDLLNDLHEQVLDRLPRGISVVKHIEIEQPLVIDRMRIARALVNIIRNAAEAMPNGGQLRLTMTPAEPDSLEIGVADTGSGIPEDVLPTIFEPFVTNGKPGGTGLGLAISKAVIEAHGGSIAVESRVGAGTSFTIRLPRASAVPLAYAD
jgi:signal transduction histidine kinase